MSAHVCAIVRACVRVRLPTGGRVRLPCNIKKMHPSMQTHARMNGMRTHVPPKCSTCQWLSVPDGHAAERKSPACVRCHTRWPLWCYNSSGEYRGCQRTRPRRRRYLDVLAMHWLPELPCSFTPRSCTPRMRHRTTESAPIQWPNRTAHVDVLPKQATLA